MTIYFKSGNNVFFSVEVNGKEQPFNYPISDPTGTTVETLTGKTQEFFTLEILKNLYPESPVYNQGLDEWAFWIAEECWVVPVEGEPYQIMAKDLPPHPAQTRMIDGYQISDETYALLDAGKTKLFIETVFGKMKRPKK